MDLSGTGDGPDDYVNRSVRHGANAGGESGDDWDKVKVGRTGYACD